jgi:hypothetical protein
MAAKEKWNQGRISDSRHILEAAFHENPNSEKVPCPAGARLNVL